MIPDDHILSMRFDRWCGLNGVDVYEDGAYEKWRAARDEHMAKIPAWFTTTESTRFKGLDKDRTLVILTRIHPDDLAAPCCPWVGK